MTSELHSNSKAQSDGQSLEILLNHQEFKTLQKLLPVGFSLSVSNKNTRMQHRKPVSQAEPLASNTAKIDKSKRKAYAEAEQTIRGTSEAFKKCTKVLNALKRNANAGPFLEPVDPVALGIPTYFDIIKKPMDLSTVEKKIKNHDYDSPEQFENDVRLIWNNAMTFNPPGSQVHRMAENMSIYFEDLLKREEEGSVSSKPHHDRYKKRVNDIEEGTTSRAQKGPTSKNLMEKPLTYQEKKQLSNMIRMLPTEHLWGVWNIVSGGDTNRTNEELEFDIETLAVRTARELEKYVKSKVSNIQKKKKPSGPSPTTEPTQHKLPAGFKEDTKTSENKTETPSQPAQPPAPLTKPVTQGPVTKSMQPNFRIDNEQKKKLSSESSFISDLEDSEA